MKIRNRYAHMTTTERLEAIEKAQRLHEWIIVGSLVVLALIGLSYTPDLYDAVHGICAH